MQYYINGILKKKLTKKMTFVEKFLIETERRQIQTQNGLSLISANRSLQDANKRHLCVFGTVDNVNALFLICPLGGNPA